MKYPVSIINLIDSFKKLPSIGEKTAERLALAVLDMDKNNVEVFSQSLIDCKTKIKKCDICGNLSEDSICDVCKDDTRNKTTLCIVEEPKNIALFEKLNIYNGLYHVLDGLISPIDGKNPEDLNIFQLENRIKEGNIKELILALKPSVEGETTSLYITKILEKYNLKITKIAYGIPMGADMDYVDSMTLELALENRMEIKN